MKLSGCRENYYLSSRDVKVAGHFVEGEGAVHTTRVILVVRGNPPVHNRVKLVTGNIFEENRAKKDKILLLEQSLK
jgi:hypothetical protein